ncbi:MAG: hypothetical protein Fur006_02410 [Coleofasciculaceae cyanobacterium]
MTPTRVCLPPDAGNCVTGALGTITAGGTLGNAGSSIGKSAGAEALGEAGAERLATGEGLGVERFAAGEEVGVERFAAGEGLTTNRLTADEETEGLAAGAERLGTSGLTPAEGRVGATGDWGG